MLAKVTELKGWVTPCFPFMTLGDNIYEADDGWTELRITPGQKYYRSSSGKTQVACIPLFLFLEKTTTTRFQFQISFDSGLKIL